MVHFWHCSCWRFCTKIVHSLAEELGFVGYSASFLSWSDVLLTFFFTHFRQALWLYAVCTQVARRLHTDCTHSGQTLHLNLHIHLHQQRLVAYMMATRQQDMERVSFSDLSVPAAGGDTDRLASAAATRRNNVGLLYTLDNELVKIDIWVLCLHIMMYVLKISTF